MKLKKADLWGRRFPPPKYVAMRLPSPPVREPLEETNLIGVKIEFDIGSSNDGRTQAPGYWSIRVRSILRLHDAILRYCENPIVFTCFAIQYWANWLIKITLVVIVFDMVMGQNPDSL